MKRIYIFSLKYAAGLYKEFSLLGRLFEKNNFNVTNFLSKGYIKHCNNNNNVIVSNGINNKGMLKDILFFPLIIYKIYKNIDKNKKQKFFLFYNPHPINFLIQMVLRFIPNSKIVIVLHEPYKTIKDRLEYGLKGFLFFSIVNFLQYLSIKLSDKIITMSPYGKELFLKYFEKDKNKLISANLLIDNKYYIKPFPYAQREYFSYIGRVNKGKGIDDFINIINYCIKNKISKYKFLIITSSNIDIYIQNILNDYETVLTIINKNNILDKEINEVILRSKAVLILHQTASQSGVLPLCCKYGTPIIARDIKAFRQYYRNNGVLLNKKFKPREFIEACDKIEKNFEIYSKNSKNIFQEYFSEDNFQKFYKELIND
jgi:glycosyltransferase involved in cell wall biosynthesis